MIIFSGAYVLGAFIPGDLCPGELLLIILRPHHMLIFITVIKVANLSEIRL